MKNDGATANDDLVAFALPPPSTGCTRRPWNGTWLPTPAADPLPQKRIHSVVAERFHQPSPFPTAFFRRLLAVGRLIDHESPL